MSLETLRNFGKVIERISKETDDDNELRLQTFLKYVSDHYPQILSINVAEPVATKVEVLLDKLDLPVFDVDIHPFDEKPKRTGWQLHW